MRKVTRCRYNNLPLCEVVVTLIVVRAPTMFWDKGPDALSAFVQSHICNSLCEYLELDDLEDFDVYKLAEDLKAERNKAEMEVIGSQAGRSDEDDVIPSDKD